MCHPEGDHKHQRADRSPQGQGRNYRPECRPPWLRGTGRISAIRLALQFLDHAQAVRIFVVRLRAYVSN